MKVLHINTNDGGGAATACIRIHRLLLKKGIDSKVLVLNKTKKEPGVYQYNYWEGTKSKLDSIIKRIKLFLYKRKMRKLVAGLPPNTVQFSFPSTIYDITEHPLYKEADIIQLNWVSGFLDESSFFAKNTKPVIWRMSDLYICGGGNHYEKNFPFDTFKKYTSKNYTIREKALKNKFINIVPISNWTKDKALDSPLLKNYPMTVIHNGVDIELFKQYDRDFTRNLWGLPLDKTIILIGAASVNDPRKGISLLIEAISQVESANIHFCVFGGKLETNHQIQELGVVNDERLLATLYAAADLFVMSSIEETFGQVTIESIACGTPVISFPTGGSVDIIKDSFNGILAQDFTADSLYQAIKKGLETNFNRKEIREDAISRFNIEDKATSYIHLYKSILSQN